VAELVRYAQMEGKALPEMSLDEYRRFSPAFDEDVLALDLRSAIEARDAPGGTSSRQVELALKRARQRLGGKA
jgi:argininosuccinate lyase